jgi:hypothetical protein
LFPMRGINDRMKWILDFEGAVHTEVILECFVCKQLQEMIMRRMLLIVSKLVAESGYIHACNDPIERTSCRTSSSSPKTYTPGAEVAS